jgi:3-dehydroquinate dehydratase I
MSYIGSTSRPIICAPIVGKDRDSVLGELHLIISKDPDAVEWRIDHFEQVRNIDHILKIAEEFREIAGNKLILFTLRSVTEGGHPVNINKDKELLLNQSICRYTDFEYVDCEMNNKPEFIKALLKTARENKTRLIGSYHNFDITPDDEKLDKLFLQAKELGMDVAKVAVMPQNENDVLRLLSATNRAKQRLGIPIISMSMGGLGSISRIAGGIFGSGLSFAVGANESAPGQIPIEDLKIAFEIIERSSLL